MRNIFKKQPKSHTKRNILSFGMSILLGSLIVRKILNRNRLT